MKIDLGNMGKWEVVTADYYSKDGKWHPIDIAKIPSRDTSVLRGYHFCADSGSLEFRLIYFHSDGRYAPDKHVCRLRIKVMD